VHEKQVAFPKGDPRSPLTDEELTAKFKRLSAAVLPPARQAHAADVALNLRRHSISALVEACSPEHV
jgi:2-methylcitrate dehydratase PrpD